MKPKKVKTSVELREENHVQLQRLAQIYHLSHNSVIAQAIARWYYEDPVAQKKRRPRHVADHS